MKMFLVVTNSRILWASTEERLGMELNILQYARESGTTRIIQPKIPVTLRLRNPELDKAFTPFGSPK